MNDKPFDYNKRKIRDFLPYTTREVSNRVLSYGWGIMVSYTCAIGTTKGSRCIEEFYKGKPVLIGLPMKRYKFNRN